MARVFDGRYKAAISFEFKEKMRFEEERFSQFSFTLVDLMAYAVRKNAILLNEIEDVIDFGNPNSKEFFIKELNLSLGIGKRK